MYAVGWTQHSVGTQYIRAASILQLLLGNIGRPGGGIQALRGHASIQGSSDIPTLFNLLPGYLPMPHAHKHLDLDTFVETSRTAKGFWAPKRAYFVSLMKAYYGDAATVGRISSGTSRRFGVHALRRLRRRHRLSRGPEVLGDATACGNAGVLARSPAEPIADSGERIPADDVRLCPLRVPPPKGRPPAGIKPTFSAQGNSQAIPGQGGPCHGSATSHDPRRPARETTSSQSDGSGLL